MSTPISSGPTGKISRIQREERQLLSQLREIYNNDYKKYFECIRRGVNIPIAIRKIYRSLDEYKAYRRISDYFHRQRIAKRPKRSKDNDRAKSTRISTHPPRTTSTIYSDDKLSENDDHTSEKPTKMIETLCETSERMDEDDIEEIQPLSSITFTQQRLSSSNNPPPSPSQSTDPLNSQPNLLSIRQNLQKALRELDHAIVVKTDNTNEEHSIERPKLFLSNGNEQCFSKLDDFVRSLSTVVDQQQENVRLIINESSVLLVDDSKSSDKLSSTTQDSIKHILERLNTLIDRGHHVYDRIESILSKF